MRRFIRTRWPLVVLLTLTGVSSALAQAQPRQSDGWQGPRPTPQQSTPMPAPQRPAPSGKQVLELPSQPQQRTLEPPRQQAVIPPRPQSETPRPTQLVTVTVTDPNGRYVSGLSREDFIVYEDGVRQDITYFNTGEKEPVSLGLVVDTSSSMHAKIGRARLALHRFVGSIQPQDEVFVEEFNVQPALVQDFTDSRRLLAQAVNRLRPAGGTALHDAILDGLRRIKRGRHQKKALIVISDGLDTASLASLNQTIDIARRSGVLIYTIGIGSPHGGGISVAIGPLAVFGGGGGFDEQVDARTLQALSDETGGKHFLLSTHDVIANETVLETATETISRELRVQYSVGYASASGGRRYHNVRVETRQDDLVVRAQKGYASE
jgi:Ca-activated chloride channel family protein